MSADDRTANQRTPIERVLDEFGFGDGLVNATPEDAERMAAEIVRLRSDAEAVEMEAMRRKYLHYGQGPQTPPDDANEATP